MTGVYALIGPDGELQFCDGVPGTLKGASPRHAAVAFTMVRPG